MKSGAGLEIRVPWWSLRELILIMSQLRVTIFDMNLSRRRMGLGDRPGVGQPEAQVFQYPTDGIRAFDKAYDSHGRRTARTAKWIYLVDFFDQSRPVPPECLRRDYRLEHGGDRLHFLPFPLPAAC